MNSLTRRNALAALGAIAVSAAVPLPTGAAAEFDWEPLTVDEWLASKGPDLSDIADMLARWERNGIERELPILWRRQEYVATMEFRAGVTLVYGFNGLEPMPSERDGIYAWLEEGGFEILADGWSTDRRAWTLFIRGEHADVRRYIDEHAALLDVGSPPAEMAPADNPLGVDHCMGRLLASLDD
jgi:hypothetical protein